MNPSALSLLKENKLHGDPMLPVGVYENRFYPGGRGFDCHWHDETEFLLVLEGEVLFQVDTDYFRVKAGEALFIDGGDIHAALDVIGDTSCLLTAIVFDAAWLESGSFDAVQKHYVSPLLERKKTFPLWILPASAWKKDLLDHLMSIVAAYGTQLPGFEIKIKAITHTAHCIFECLPHQEGGGILVRLRQDMDYSAKSR